VNGTLAKLVVAAALAIGLGSHAAAAYPDKSIRLIITAPPGGTIDFLARLVAIGMSRELGQQVVVDNRGGASGLLGADLAAKSAPDGYTVLLTDGAALAVNSAVRKDMPFDAQRDLIPVSLVATLPTGLAVNPAFPVSTVKEFVAYAKQNPGKISYATPGVGTPHHLAATLLSKSAGIELTHIPYKGGGPMVTDVVGGQVPVLFTGVLPMLPFIKSGKLKPIAVASPQRLAQLPDVPTFVESGFPDFEVQVFFSMFVPAKTPAEIGAALQQALTKTLADPELRKKLEEQTLVVVGSSPDQLRAHFAKESAKWGELIRTTGMVLE
jgi:tripartite-type tricarboxylate transporter receptor subunit TctC